VSAHLDAAYCSKCDAILSEEYCLPDPNRVPCPICGETARRFNVSIEEKIEILETLDTVGVRAGKSRSKGWFIRSRSALVRQRNRDGAIAHHERVLDREANRYFEKVTMRDTGEIVHYCDESLSEHKGHGSDKTNPRSSSASDSERTVE
jgi:hypothetical protein